MKLEHSYDVDGDINHYYFFRLGDPYKNVHKYLHSGLELDTKPVPDPLAAAMTPVPSRGLARPLPHLWLPLASGFCQALDHDMVGLPVLGLSPWCLRSLLKAHLQRSFLRSSPTLSRWPHHTAHLPSARCVCGLSPHPLAGSTL